MFFIKILAWVKLIKEKFIEDNEKVFVSVEFTNKKPFSLKLYTNSKILEEILFKINYLFMNAKFLKKNISFIKS